MRVSLILGLSLTLAASASWAQQSQTFRVKPSRVEGKKPARSEGAVKTPNAATDTAKDLHRLEQQSVKPLPMGKTAGAKRASGAAPQFKAEKPRPAPPINASVPPGLGVKSPGMNNQGKNPYRGRLRQKGARH